MFTVGIVADSDPTGWQQTVSGYAEVSLCATYSHHVSLEGMTHDVWIWKTSTTYRLEEQMMRVATLSPKVVILSPHPLRVRELIKHRMKHVVYVADIVVGLARLESTLRLAHSCHSGSATILPHRHPVVTSKIARPSATEPGIQYMQTGAQLRQ